MKGPNWSATALRFDRIRVKIDHLKRSMLNPAAAVAAAAAARHAVSTDDGAAAFVAGKIRYRAQILLIPSSLLPRNEGGREGVGERECKWRSK